MGELNMGNPQTLEDFASWAISNYPAAHYYLAIDDHGSGPWGISWDDTSNSDNITIPELNDALNSVTNNGTAKIDIVAFEACLMGLYENAYDIRNYANYLFFFESISYGDTETYSSYLSGLTSGMTAEQLGKRIVEQYTQLLSFSSTPHVSALVDLSQMDALQSAIDDLVNALSGADSAKIAQARSDAQKFEENGDDVIGDSDPYVDLWDLADQFSVQIPAAATQAGLVKAAVEAAVADYRATSGYDWDHSNAHGLAIYYPDSATGAYSDYVNDQFYNSTRNGLWDEFLEGLYDTYSRSLSTNRGPVDRITDYDTDSLIYIPLVTRK